MFLIDDLVKLPLNIMLWSAQKVASAAQHELQDDEQDLMNQLIELHRELESGRMSEREFDEQEAVLLDRLDKVKALQEGRTGAS